MFYEPAIPESLERGHFVITRAFSGPQRKRRVGAYADSFQDVKPKRCRVVLWRRETVHRDQHIVGIERWRVARRAALLFEDLFPALRNSIEAIWVNRRLE